MGESNKWRSNNIFHPEYDQVIRFTPFGNFTSLADP